MACRSLAVPGVTAWLYAPYQILVLSSGVWRSLLLIRVICDVTIWRHIHVYKPTLWRSLLIQHIYHSTRTFLTRCCRNSAFQPGFRGTSGFRDCLPGFPPKQAEIAWDEICNQIYTGPSPGFNSSGDHKPQRGHIFKYSIGCIQQPGPNIKWGHIF